MIVLEDLKLQDQQSLNKIKEIELKLREVNEETELVEMTTEQHVTKNEKAALEVIERVERNLLAFKQQFGQLKELM